MGKIKLLEDTLINLIAAGEVVERPASVVKELMENSLDAGASRIIVKLVAGGLEEITVEDNGAGMGEADARMAFKQHATSKIGTTEDLNSIATLGFRGEALASISGVAGRIVLETKEQGSEALQLEILKDNITLKKSGRANQGTSISIFNLFERVPARKSFMRSISTEFAHCQDTFIGLALAHNQVHFELYNNSKLVLRLPSTDHKKERIFQIFGEATANNLYQVDTNSGNTTLTALIGSPDIARKDRKHQYILLNGRVITDRVVQRAVNDAYKGFIHRDLQPVYFLFLQLPPDSVDVNVHPRKLEVRFKESGQVFNLVHSAVNSTLLKATKQSMSERISDSMSRGNIELHEGISVPRSAGRSGKTDWPAFKSHTSPMRSSAKAMDFTRSLLSSDKPSTPEINHQYGAVNCFQLFATYILYQNGEDCIVIDQHAAAEKVLYEKLLGQLDTRSSAPLLVPEIIELPQELKEATLSIAPDLKKTGLEVEDFGGNSIQVLAKPQIASNLKVKEFLEHLSQTKSPTQEMINNGVTDQIHLLIATMACHGAIRAGQLLSQQEMRQLVTDLNACNSPYNCPHGRPVSWVLSRRELEKNFKRII